MPDVPTGLLRSPGGGGLQDAIEQPLEDELRNQNRFRRPTATGLTTRGNIFPVLSEDSPGVFVSRTRTSKAGTANVIGLADREPDSGELLGVQINSVRVMTGRINNATLTDEGILNVTAFDDTRVLRRTDFSRSYNEQSLGQVVKDVCRHAGVRANIDRKYFALDQIDIEGNEIEPGYQRLVDEEGRDALTGEPTTAGGETTEDEPGSAERDYLTVTHDFESANCMGVLDDLAAAADALAYVNERNILRFTDSPDVDERVVNGILESDAGGQSPPYSKIVVVGGAKNGTAGGERRRPRKSKHPIRAVAGDRDAPAEQTYVARRPGVTSQRMAKNIANAVWKETKRQSAKGSIVLAGRAVLAPLDVAIMPDYYEDTEYLVSGIEHRIDKDRFASTIHAGGRV